ncbi:hypothetical protein SERLA73DRAFT_143174 [Serpula lacrymans var. lacrymans S7.3]|uniref:Uncharacterized protein n=2 Tax=Serpula lacrymans var. lacrymans TaxID=341189 RepID=F8Q952_SERL3|nr:uncharacterized protein SERLADRAFT_399611 [Serpula lacrymans var. lacrymans S7.9]EGN95107.1 hypothetical protein SERLA73DRAFT_143174 [Serpula lacrymans var. lacrymans S7.3]EGO20594.1 hypothetical protein SERLADRAFT_399611 [Serpula lacrymans var. lacrymans S7.9]
MIITAAAHMPGNQPSASMSFKENTAVKYHQYHWLEMDARILQKSVMTGQVVCRQLSVPSVKEISP